MTAKSQKPRINAHRISQAMMPAIWSACRTASKMVTRNLQSRSPSEAGVAPAQPLKQGDASRDRMLCPEAHSTTEIVDRAEFRMDIRGCSDARRRQWNNCACGTTGTDIVIENGGNECSAIATGGRLRSNLRP